MSVITQEVIDALYNEVDDIMKYGDVFEAYDFIRGLADKYHLIYTGDTNV